MRSWQPNTPVTASSGARPRGEDGAFFPCTSSYCMSSRIPVIIFLSSCLFRLGKPIPHWSMTQGLPQLTRKNNFKIRLLAGCHGLEADANGFRWRRLAHSSQHVPTCKLCGLEPEDPSHFITCCPSLSLHRDCLLSMADSSFNLLAMSQFDSMRFVNVVLGVDWIDNSGLQHFLIEFLNSLLQESNSLLISAHHYM